MDAALKLKPGTHIYRLPEVLQDAARESDQVAPKVEQVEQAWEEFLAQVSKQRGNIVAIIDHQVWAPLSADYISASGASESTMKFALITAPGVMAC